jgi:hypothetical protein
LRGGRKIVKPKERHEMRRRRWERAMREQEYEEEDY